MFGNPNSIMLSLPKKKKLLSIKELKDSLTANTTITLKKAYMSVNNVSHQYPFLKISSNQIVVDQALMMSFLEQ